MALDWDKIQGRTKNTNNSGSNTVYKSSIDWDKIQGRKKAVPITQLGTNAINSANSVINNQISNSAQNVAQQGINIANNYINQNKTTPISSASNKLPTFKTLEEAQEYAKNNNLKVSSIPKEQMEKWQSIDKLTNQIPEENVIELNDEDKDYYKRNLYIFKNEKEDREKYYNSAKKEYAEATSENKQKAYENLKKQEEAYKKSLKEYNTALAYERHYNPLGVQARNFLGNVAQGTANVANFLKRRFNSIDDYNQIEMNPQILYELSQSPNDEKKQKQAMIALYALKRKANTSENLKELLDEIESGTFKGNAEDIKNIIENARIENYEENKIMKNTYDYVEDNNEIANKMNLSNTEMALYNAGSTIGNMIPTIATGMINPTLGKATLFSNANESGFNEAIREGASYDEARKYGTLVGGIEVGSEMLFDSYVGKALGFGGLASSEPYANYMGNIVGNKFGSMAGKIARGATNYIGNSIGEGTEEVVSEFLNPLAKRITYNPNAPLATPEDLDNAFMSSLLPTAIMGGGTQILNYAGNKINNRGLENNSSSINLQKNNIQNTINNQVQQASNEISQQPQIQNKADLTINSTNDNNIDKNHVQNNQIQQQMSENISQNNVQQSLGTQQVRNAEVTQEIQTFVDNRNKISPGLSVEMDSTLNVDGVIEKRADGTRVIKINPNSSKAYEFVVVHEMLHDLEGTQEYQELSNFVKERAITQEEFEEAKKAITEQYTKYYQENGLDMSGLNMEVETTNDMAARVLGNQEFLNELAGNKPNIFMRMYNWIKNVAFDGQNTGKTFNERRAQNKYLQELKSKFEIAYNTAYKGTENKTSYHISSNLSDDIDNILSGNILRNKIVVREYTPEILVNIGLEDLPMVMKSSHIRENILSETEATSKGLKVNNSTHYHGLGKEMFMRAIDELDNPVAIYKWNANNKNKYGNNDYIVLTELVAKEKGKDGRVIVPLYLENKNGTYEIKTIYGKNRIFKYLNYNKNILENVYTKKANKIGGVQFSVSPESFSNYSIPSNNSTVNNQYMQNSQNNTQNSNNQSSFSLPKISENEKMRQYTINKPFNLGESYKLYRGISETGDGTGTALYGDGLYFTTNKKYASQFGNVIEIERNQLPSNPLQFRTETDFSQWEKELANSLGISKNQLYNNDNVDKYAKVLGYDGITVGTGKDMIIVKFNSNQEYSQSNDKWQSYLDKNWDLMPNSTKTFGSTTLEELQEDYLDSGDKSGATVTTKKYEVSKINSFMDKVLAKMETTRFGNTKELKNITKAIVKDIKNNTLTNEKAKQYLNVIYDAAIRIDSQFYEENKAIKDTIRNTKLYVSPETRSGMTDWQDFRKSNFGILSLSEDKNNLDIDTFYKELSSERADLFPKTITNQIDQLERISEVAKSIRKIEQKASEYLENNYGKEIREATIEEMQKDMNELVQDINQVQKVEAENLKKMTEKSELLETGKNLTVEQIKELQKENTKLKREYEKALRKELLTERDKLQLDRLVKGEITLDEINGQSNREAIKRLYELKKPLEDNNNKILQAKKAKKAVRFAMAEEAVKNSGNWKDKKLLGGLRYSTETAERIIYDIVQNEAEAKNVIDTYFTPVHEHEAHATRKKNEIVDRIKKLNISIKENYEVSESIREKINKQLPKGEVYKETKLSESSLVQLLGEKIIDTKDIQELGADVSKIENATNVFREVYNELFELSNDALIANGYPPVEYRKDYFPHFTEEKPDTVVKKILSKFGVETSNQELSTDLAGLTHTFKPGKKWVGNFLERKSTITDYNALKGLDTYLEPVMDVIYHTEDIQNLRALEDTIRYKYSEKGIQEQIDNTRDRLDLDDIQKNAILNDLYNTDTTDFSHFVTWLRGYTDNLSGKKSIEDRNMEHKLGRAAYNTMKNVEGKVASNMIGANINSALTNFIPLAQGWGEVSTGSMAKAMWDTARNVSKSDNFVENSNFLINRRGNDRLYKDWKINLSEKAGKPMSAIDEFTSETLVRAKYYDNIKAGMTQEDAMANANTFAASVMGDRSKGAMPTIFNEKNPITKTFTMFQLEVNNQYRYWLKDLPRNVRDEVGNSLAKALFKIFLGSWLYGEIKEKLTGTRSVTDPIDMVADTFKDVLDENVGAGKTIMNLGNRIVDELPFISTLTGGGRIPISAAFPDLENTLKATTGLATGEMDTGKATGILLKELSKPAYYLLLPTAGGQIKKTIEGISTVANGGEYGIDSEGNKTLKFPVDTKNMNTLEKVGTYAKAATFGKYSLPTARDYIDNGNKQLSAKKTQGYKEAIKKGITAKQYLDINQQIGKIKPDNGEKFVTNERRTKIINIIESQDLTKEQKEYLYKVFYKNEI